MKVDESNPLYAACVGFMVAENSEADSWAKVARFVQTMVENGHGDTVQLKAEFSVVEKQIKHDFSITTLPTAWRTAKSTSLAAARESINLIDAAGNVKGKSSIEDEVKAKNLMVGEGAQHPAHLAANFIDKAAVLMTGLRVDEAQNKAIAFAMERLATAAETIVNA